MTNSLIKNPSSDIDLWCNSVIDYSSTVANELNITYSELWLIISLLIILLIVWYNTIILFLLYNSKINLIKWIYYIINFLILGFTFFTISDYIFYL